MSEEIEIIFACSVYKVQTLVDGGIRVSLDIPGPAIIEAGALIKCQQSGIGLNVTCIPYEIKSNPKPIDRSADGDIDGLIESIE